MRVWDDFSQCRVDSRFAAIRLLFNLDHVSPCPLYFAAGKGLMSGKAMGFGGFCGIAAFQSAILTLLVWLEVGREFGWLDAAVGISAGVGIATTIALWIRYLRYLKNSRGHSLRLPSKRIPRFLAAFALYSCAFIFIYLIPMMDSRLFHPPNQGRHTLTWAVGYSLWMGLWFAVRFGRKRTSSQQLLPESGAGAGPS